MSSRRLILSFALGGLLLAGEATSASAAAPSSVPPPAEAVLDAASKAAKAGSRNVLVLFHASWCGWCRKLESVLATPGVREVLSRHYERVDLTVLERGEKKALENAGAGELMTRLAGANAGLPFTAVLDRKSRKALGTSNLNGPGTNVGYPAKAEEIDHFVGMLKGGAPGMTAAEAETLRAAFSPR